MMRNSWIVASLAAMALAGCEPGTSKTPMTSAAAGTSGGGDLTVAGATPAATSVRLVDHDVEAPEAYQANAKALWDGRPSLGGVWVATPDAKNPERVIMRNPTNGKFVIGGLFQRDASLPGPKLQLSSDAADALGLVAGQPAVITVTALRRDEPASPAPDATKPLLDANASAQAGAKPAVDTAAAATASKTGKPAAVAATTAVTAAGTKPAAPMVQSTTPMAKPTTQTAATAQPMVQAATPVAPITPAASGPMIQIGIFSVEANAKRASDVLKNARIATTTTAETSHDKPLWSVTARGNAGLLEKIKAAGFKDAYLLKH